MIQISQPYTKGDRKQNTLRITVQIQNHPRDYHSGKE